MENIRKENELLKEYLKKHFIATCPDMLCVHDCDDGKCDKCAESFIENIINQE